MARGRNNSQLAQRFRRLALRYLDGYGVPSNVTNSFLLSALRKFQQPIEEPSTKIERYKWWVGRLSQQDRQRDTKIRPPRERIEKSNRQSFYLSKEWRTLRYQVLKMYGGCCQCCGCRPSDVNPLHVDHIKPISKFPELKLNFDNLQVLCSECNLGKSNLDSTDWRCLKVRVPVYS